MSNRIHSVYKDMTIEESTRNVDLSDTAQPIKHTQIKWTNYTATPWISALTRLVMLIILSGKIWKGKAWKERSNSGGKKKVQQRNECEGKLTYSFLGRCLCLLLCWT